MVKMSDFDADKLSRAVIVWTGYGTQACPTREDTALVSICSAEEAARLATIVRALEEDFYKSDAHITAASLSEMKNAALSDFKRLHPELPSVIAEAFAWCYTFDYK